MIYFYLKQNCIKNFKYYFSQDEINEIIVKLQLNGYYLNNKKTGK